jgi:ABC-type glutathione transport system ATPase component
MEKQAEYIQRIEIDHLWDKGKHIVWNMRPDVNILSGVNGVGKSTILNRSVESLVEQGRALTGERLKAQELLADGVKVTFYPEDATFVKYDVIRSFDRPLLNSDLLAKMGEGTVMTELDFQFFMLQRKYLDYQVNIGNRMIELLTSCAEDAHARAAEVAQIKSRFQDLVDSLFQDTGKTILRTCNEVRFMQGGQEIYPYQLSSGEKQMMIILLTVLVEDNEPYVLFMDEPEVSLHVEWQRKLIQNIRTLNPNVQIVLTTHSPAVIMDGWGDVVTEVSDITI